MTKAILNLIGASGVGKTTTSAKLFAKLKELNLNVAYSQEVVKIWVWEGRKVNKYDQYYLFGSECHNQSRLFDAVDILISDSSPILAAFYNYYYSGFTDNSLAPACKEFYRKVSSDNIHVLNFYLPRKKQYVSYGRYQTQEESDALAIDLKNWLDEQEYPYIDLECEDEQRLDNILDYLKKELGDLNGFSMV